METSVMAKAGGNPKKETDNSKKVAGKDVFVGPPWAPAPSMRALPSTDGAKNPIDKCFSKMKSASDNAKLSDAYADFVANTIAIVNAQPK